MKEKIIKFSSVKDVEKFIAKADKCNFEIDVWYNHILLDGKSILALLSLDFSQPVKVKYAGENHQFEALLGSLARNNEAEAVTYGSFQGSLS